MKPLTRWYHPLLTDAQAMEIDWQHITAFAIEDGDRAVVFGTNSIYPWCGEAFLLLKNPGPAILKKARDWIHENRHVFPVRVETRIETDKHVNIRFAQWMGFQKESLVGDWLEPGKFGAMMIMR